MMHLKTIDHSSIREERRLTGYNSFEKHERKENQNDHSITDQTPHLLHVRVGGHISKELHTHAHTHTDTHTDTHTHTLCLINTLASLLTPTSGKRALHTHRNSPQTPLHTQHK